MSHQQNYGDTIPLHSTHLHSSSSQSDIDEIENLIHSSLSSSSAVVPSPVPPTAASPPSPPRAQIPVSYSLPPLPPTSHKPLPIPVSPAVVPSIHIPAPSVTSSSSNSRSGIEGFGPPPNTLTEPVWDTVKRDLSRIVSNLKLVVFPNPYREDPGKALRDWDLWGPFFFIVFLGLVLSWSASVKKSEVFAVAFAVLAAGAVILTVNVLLLVLTILLRVGWLNFVMTFYIFHKPPSRNGLVIICLAVFVAMFQGGHIIFFQSLSLLGYCLFPLDIGALICLLKDNVILKIIVVSVALAWSSWAAYPFMSTAVNPRRKALALYPVFLMYVSVGFLIIAID